jgi:hypothetical protein
MEYRIQSTGEVKTQGEVRRMHSNTSLPRVWDANVCSALGIDPVLAAPKPEVTGYTQSIRNGATQDANDNWVQAWSVVDMFQDYTDDEGVTHTKADQEAEYQARLDAEAAKGVRTTRDAKLAETDWTALTDVTMAAEMAVYRQALRDITTHANFPNLTETDWPTKPE